VLTALYGDRLCEFDYEDAEESGAVVPGVVYFLETPDLPRTYSNIDQSMKWALKMHDGRNRLIGQVAAAVPPDWQCIAFVDHVADHLVEVAKYMPTETKWMHRSSSKKESGKFALTTKQQNQVMDSFANNEFRLLIATDCLRAGVSVDNVRCVIQCSGGTSEVELLQEAYRGSRIMTEATQAKLGVSPKTHFVLIDFDDQHDNILANMSKARRKIYAEQGWTIRDVKSVDEIDFTWDGKT
jgi:superfamily II DNA or RNA helicase